MVTTRPAPFVARARDGTPLLVRAVGPEHRQCFIEGLARLSEESRYRRFARPMPGYTDQQLRYLTEIDYRDHMAWLAADLSVPGLPGVAVARYVRRRDDPRCAEAAVTVIDDYQGRGIAPLLLGHLADTARANGIERFEGDILGRNYPMLKVARRLGITDFAIVDGMVHFSAPLPPVLPPAA
ncbi:MAG TPA: GNAT family N-acetyltransferase [Alphaproteobacteria bacterium]|nr:GNAT family N-acetyltransferase [Alphaproteobacteria bacterium]